MRQGFDLPQLHQLNRQLSYPILQKISESRTFVAVILGRGGQSIYESDRLLFEFLAPMGPCESRTFYDDEETDQPKMRL